MKFFLIVFLVIGLMFSGAFSQNEFMIPAFAHPDPDGPKEIDDYIVIQGYPLVKKKFVSGVGWEYVTDHKLCLTVLDHWDKNSYHDHWNPELKIGEQCIEGKPANVPQDGEITIPIPSHFEVTHGLGECDPATPFFYEGYAQLFWEDLTGTSAWGNKMKFSGVVDLESGQASNLHTLGLYYYTVNAVHYKSDLITILHKDLKSLCPEFELLTIKTDKYRYQPGDSVTISIDTNFPILAAISVIDSQQSTILLRSMDIENSKQLSFTIPQNVLLGIYDVVLSATINDEEYLVSEEFFVSSSEKSDELVVPSWVKIITDNWIDGNISDYEFVNAIGFLVQQGIINVEVNIGDKFTVPLEIVVPEEIKNQAVLWMAGTNTDGPWMRALTHLIEFIFPPLKYSPPLDPFTGERKIILYVPGTPEYPRFINSVIPSEDGTQWYPHYVYESFNVSVKTIKPSGGFPPGLTAFMPYVELWDIRFDEKIIELVKDDATKKNLDPWRTHVVFDYTFKCKDASKTEILFYVSTEWFVSSGDETKLVHFTKKQMEEVSHLVECLPNDQLVRNPDVGVDDMVNLSTKFKVEIPESAYLEKPFTVKYKIIDESSAISNLYEFRHSIEYEPSPSKKLKDYLPGKPDFPPMKKGSAEGTKTFEATELFVCKDVGKANLLVPFTIFTTVFFDGKYVGAVDNGKNLMETSIECKIKNANGGDDIPEPDRDGDGIPDAKDKCPYEAEDMDGVEDSDGCPE